MTHAQFWHGNMSSYWVSLIRSKYPCSVHFAFFDPFEAFSPNPLFYPVGETVEQHPVQGRAQPAVQIHVPPVADPMVHAKAPPAAQADDLPAVRADISASSLSTPSSSSSKAISSVRAPPPPCSDKFSSGV